MKVFAFVGAAILVATAQADTFDMNVFNFDFSANLPGEPIVDAVISVGDTVHWDFIDGGHSVTSVMGIPEVFDSGVLDDAGSVFEHTFTNVGTCPVALRCWA